MDYDDLAETVGLEPRESESFDVLLQLTLPIVLILAFVVVTELATLRRNEDRFKDAVQGTPIKTHLDMRAALQRLLIEKAVEQVMKEEEATTGIGEYKNILPTADQVLEEQLPERFREITLIFHRRYNDPYRSTKWELRERIRRIYEKLAAANPDLVEREISQREMDDVLEAELTRRIEELIKRACDIQAMVITAWVSSGRAVKSVESESQKWWGLLQRPAAEAEPGLLSEKYRTLMVDALQRRLSDARVPLLDTVVQKVKQVRP
jgi:hypothetical protein